MWHSEVRRKGKEINGDEKKGRGGGDFPSVQKLIFSFLRGFFKGPFAQMSINAAFSSETLLKPPIRETL